MKTMTRSLVAALALVGAAVVPALASGGHQDNPPAQKWSFAGPFGTYDRAQLQRGFKVYKEVCSACHSLKLISFRNLSEKGGPEFTEGQVKTLAAEYKVKDGPNESGDMFERPARPADRFPASFANDEAAKAANNGAVPPDFSVIAKARTYSRGFPMWVLDIITQYQEQGPDYITGVLTGYEEPPHGITVEPGLNYNKYFPGNKIAMANPLMALFDDAGKAQDPGFYNDGTPVTREQVAKDVSAFLMWAAEPKLEERKQTGAKVMLWLAILAMLLYFSKMKIWSRLEGAH